MILFLISFLLFPIFTTSAEKITVGEKSITINMGKCVQPKCGCGRRCLEEGFLGSRCEAVCKCRNPF
ncbi:unnamed protein product [Cylicocyclus nassatus]|uniref:Uncharacterized protein n=1 Tax=Cylicocyclus nassatus TaxID=53992 RepID=A0AA36DIT2_CYLNA|nr:unnamed protein product [Cylicocyclus nassatus]